MVYGKGPSYWHRREGSWAETPRAKGRYQQVRRSSGSSDHRKDGGKISPSLTQSFSISNGLYGLTYLRVPSLSRKVTSGGVTSEGPSSVYLDWYSEGPRLGKVPG